MANSRRPIRSSEGFHAIIEGALADERANALGRAGRKLEEAIDTYRLLMEVDSATADQVAAALADVADAAWSLMVQRECAGFRRNNLEYIRQHYPIPRAALTRL